jgi:hypothetical protein
LWEVSRNEFRLSSFRGKIEENNFMNLRKRRLTASVMLVLIAGTIGVAQDKQSPKQDMKDAGRAIKAAAQDTGRATKKTVKKTGHKVKHETKKAVNKSAEKTRHGAEKVEHKTSTQ